ncbi:DUF4386 domain-containing protein [Gaopeijia maritima]|uniref:DUF4386 domain-containing protein n=1 Tax=Gaopeijia maritima TaxID=3119007 RepID=A0ABU9ECY2_9BACT
MTDTALLRSRARLAGLLYLVIIVSAGFAEGFVRGGHIVPGDAAATAESIRAATGLFRFGLFADLLAFVADAGVAVLLYLVLRPTSRTLALLAAAFRLVAHPAIGALNLLAHQAGLSLLEGRPAMPAFSPEQIEQLALLALDLHGYGYVIAGAFFGVHCALLGVLLLRSVHFPGWLGALLIAAGFGYLFEVTAVFAVPGLEALAASVVVVTAGIGEVVLCLYLLIAGVRRDPAAEGAG